MKIIKQEVQAIADLKAGYTLGHADVAILNELARIALASLEAEAVGTFRKGPCGYSPSFHEDAVPLYTAPPAPVSVPDEMEMDDDFDSAFEHGKAVGWNACRAAMLQGAEPVSNRDELPVWVACSERMPPPKTGVVVGCWFGRNWATKWATYLPYHPDAHQSGFLMPGGSWTPTHWMPLPAAPKQEVK